MNRVIWIVAIITGGTLIISESLIIAFHPSSGAPLIQDATTLVALALSTITSLRASGLINKNVNENGEELKKVKRNVNGNISDMIQLLRTLGVPDDKLEGVERRRRELDETEEGPYLPDDHKTSHYH